MRSLSPYLLWILLCVGCAAETISPDLPEWSPSEVVDTTQAPESDAGTQDAAEDGGLEPSPVLPDTEEPSPDGETPDDAEDGGSPPQDTEEEDVVIPPDPPPVNPCDEVLDAKDVQLPFGETLQLNKDDYLAFWVQELDCPVEITAKPPGASAEILEDARLTPDMPGLWELQRGGQTIFVSVIADYLTADTFINYNYTPASPMALIDESTLYVASPASNGVSQVNLGPNGAEELAFIPTGSWPTSLALWPDSGFLLVTQTGRDTLGFLDLEQHKIVDAIPVGDEPTNILVDGDVAWVTLSGENKVARINLASKMITHTIEVGRRPRAMVLDSEKGKLYVASLISSNEHPRGPAQPEEPLAEFIERDIAIIDTETLTIDTFVRHAGTIIRGLWLSEDGQTLVAGVTHGRNNQYAVDA